MDGRGAGTALLAGAQVTQASTALSIVLPAGTAAGIAGSYGILRSWGFGARPVARGITLVSLWNQFCNLLWPILAVFLLTAFGQQAAFLATAAFIGVAVLGVLIAGFTVVMVSNSLAYDLGGWRRGSRTGSCARSGAAR